MQITCISFDYLYEQGIYTTDKLTDARESARACPVLDVKPTRTTTVATRINILSGNLRGGPYMENPLDCACTGT